MFKLLTLRSEDDPRYQIEVVRPGELTKTASMQPQVADYLASARPAPGHTQILVCAMGAGEWYSSNSNADRFSQSSLIHVPEGWDKLELADQRQVGAAWGAKGGYGYPTFYGACPFTHHRNKDPGKALGRVVLASWNPVMKRVELVIDLDHELCQKFDGISVVERINAGEKPAVSMGCRVKFDFARCCGDFEKYEYAKQLYDPSRHPAPDHAVLEYHMKSPIRGLARTRAEYCEHMRTMRNKILPNGRKVCVDNDYPRFFDISFVLIGADKIAGTMLKVASRSHFEVMSAAEAAEKVGWTEDTVTDCGTGCQLFHSHLKTANAPLISDSLGKAWDQHEYPWEAGAQNSLLGNKAVKAYEKEHGVKVTGVGSGPSEGVFKVDVAKTASPLTDVVDAVDTLPFKPPSRVPEEFRGELTDKGLDLLGSLQAGLPRPTKTAAASKLGDITKNIAAPMLDRVSEMAAHEPDIPEDTLNQMGSCGDLSTPSHMGMILKPHEFQRVTLVRDGRRDLADLLDKVMAIFPSTTRGGSACPHVTSPCSPAIKSSLMPMFHERSAYAPPMRRRVVKITITKVLPPTPVNREEVDHPVLEKVASEYLAYRQALVRDWKKLAMNAAEDPQLHLELFGTDPLHRGFSGEKTGSDKTWMALTAVFPAMYLYSAHVQDKIDSGEQVGLLDRVIANNPHISASFAAGGLGMLMTSQGRERLMEGGSKAMNMLGRG